MVTNCLLLLGVMTPWNYQADEGSVTAPGPDSPDNLSEEFQVQN